jgi:hypothetical protein
MFIKNKLKPNLLILLAVTLITGCQSTAETVYSSQPLPFTKDNIAGHWRCSQGGEIPGGYRDLSQDLKLLTQGEFSKAELITETRATVGKLKVAIDSTGRWNLAKGHLKLVQEKASARTVDKFPWEEIYYFSSLFTQDPLLKDKRMSRHTLAIKLTSLSEFEFTGFIDRKLIACERV